MLNFFLLVSRLLQAVAVTAVALAFGYLVAAVVGWRGPNRRRRLVRVGALLAVFPACVIIHIVLTEGVYLPTLRSQSDRESKEMIEATSLVKVGDAAPAFALVDTQGRDFDLEGQRGKVVLVNFFATWCRPCLEELPHIQKLWDQYGDNDDFAQIVVGREETDESVTMFQKQSGFTFTMAADPDHAVFARYATAYIPRTYLIAPDGEICFASVGYYEEDLEQLQKELAKRLQSPP